MWSISNNGFIVITAGDTLSVPLFLNRGTKFRPVRYSLQDNPASTLYLGIMEANQSFEDAVIRKVYNSNSDINEYGDLVVTLSTTDTRYLRSGRYYYSAKLKFSDGHVETVIPATEFFIVRNKR